MSKKTAEIITVVTNPFIVGLISAYLIIQKTNLSIQNKIGWFFLILFIGFLLPLTYLYWQVKRGSATDWYLTAREQRYKILFLAAIGNLIIFLLVLSLRLPNLILGFATLAFILNTCLYLVTLFWKISIHTSAASILALIFTFVYANFFWPSFLLVFLVAWSRISLGKHSLEETLAGMILSTIIFAMVFKLFGLI